MQCPTQTPTQLLCYTNSPVATPTDTMIPQLPSSVLPARPCSTFQQQTTHQHRLHPTTSPLRSSNLAASEPPSTQCRAPTMSSVGSAGDAGYTLGKHRKTYSGSGSGSAPPLAVDDETLASLAAAEQKRVGITPFINTQYPAQSSSQSFLRHWQWW
jgi:hypothetical protein